MNNGENEVENIVRSVGKLRTGSLNLFFLLKEDRTRRFNWNGCYTLTKLRYFKIQRRSSDRWKQERIDKRYTLKLAFGGGGRIECLTDEEQKKTLNTQTDKKITQLLLPMTKQFVVLFSGKHPDKGNGKMVSLGRKGVDWIKVENKVSSS